MLYAEKTVPPYLYRRGSSALVVSFPHVGTFVPHSVARTLTDCAARRPDTDWHLPKLYDFVRELDATTLVATHSRYFIDVNRPPDGANLYPGQDTPRLCPIDTFDSQPLYRTGEPSAEEIGRRLGVVWHPYHRRLERELERVRAEHGRAILWDAHSIVAEVPRLFPGRLPDLNLGTADGASCDPALGRALLEAAGRHGQYTSVLNGRFKGGYITRCFGAPDRGIHAVQLEMVCDTYMQETSPYTFQRGKAERVRPALREMLEIAARFGA
jgi:N-formylglutamate deformylase